MEFENAIRLTEIILGLAFFQQSLEHLKSIEPHKKLFITRLLFSFLLIFGFQSIWVLTALLLISVVSLIRFQGPYNGGADRMGMLILISSFLTHVAPTQQLKEVAFGYLALQLVLSYFFAGWVKVKNPDWRRGQALVDVFEFSNYPVSESLRGLIAYPRALLFFSWIVIIFELLFPLSLLSQWSLIVALIAASLFHLSNAYFFGLNRFFWVWIAAYPSLLWLQQRIITS